MGLGWAKLRECSSITKARREVEYLGKDSKLKMSQKVGKIQKGDFSEENKKKSQYGLDFYDKWVRYWWDIGKIWYIYDW